MNKFSFDFQELLQSNVTHYYQQHNRSRTVNVPFDFTGVRAAVTVDKSLLRGECARVNVTKSTVFENHSLCCVLLTDEMREVTWPALAHMQGYCDVSSFLHSNHSGFS